MKTSTIISDKEVDLLKSMIGKTFYKYKCDPFINSPMVYGIIGIHIDEKAIKITSLSEKVRRFLKVEEVAVLKVAETTDKNIKTFMDDGEMIDMPINSKIKSISVVNDFQTIEHDGQTYEFASTVGLIFLLEDLHEISFEIGTWFSEMITIQKGYNLIDNFTPIDDFTEEWEGCEGYIPNARRQIVVME